MGGVSAVSGRGTWPVDEGEPELDAPRTRNDTGKAIDHGGGVLKHVDVTPVYLGFFWGTSAGKQVRAHNDAAMADLVKNKGMTGIWAEYGAGKGTTSPSVTLPRLNPRQMTQEQIEALVKQEVRAGKLDTSNRERVFTFVLPPGCELVTQGGESSRQGLGGYHGSVKVGGHEVYYAAMAYPQRTGGGMNGIDFNGNSADDLSIAESHEITEAVTDPNVEVAERTNDVSWLGWYDDVTRWRGRTGKGEVGDIPVTNALLDGDRALKSVWGKSDGFAFQKEWSNKDNKAELAPEE